MSFNTNQFKKLSEKEWLYNTLILSQYKIIPTNQYKNTPISISNKVLINCIVAIHKLKYSNWNFNLPFFMSTNWLKPIVKKEGQSKNSK